MRVKRQCLQLATEIGHAMLCELSGRKVSCLLSFRCIEFECCQKATLYPE